MPISVVCACVCVTTFLLHSVFLFVVPKPLVHVSNLAAQSGVSRFSELNSCFQYSKQEGLTTEDFTSKNQQYHLLIAEVPHIEGYQPFQPDPSSPLRYSTSQYTGISVSKTWPFLHVKTTPVLYILQSTAFDVNSWPELKQSPKTPQK